MTATDADELESLAQRCGVLLELLVAYEPKITGVQEKRARLKRPWIRGRCAQLAVQRYRRSLAVAKAPAAVAAFDEVVGHLLVQELRWCERSAVQACANRF